MFRVTWGGTTTTIRFTRVPFHEVTQHLAEMKDFVVDHSFHVVPPNLSPETATTSNFGILLTPTENLYISLDFWNFDFEDTLVLESFDALTFDCFDPTSATAAEACGKITFQDPANPTPAGFQRAEVTYQNGPNMTTNGVDWNIIWEIPSDSGTGSWVPQGPISTNLKWRHLSL